MHGELLDQWPRDIGAGRRDADPVVGGVLGVPEAAVAVNEDDVGVARQFQVLPGEGQRRGVDVDGDAGVLQRRCPESAGSELDRDGGRRVLSVEDRVDLNDLQTAEQP